VNELNAVMRQREIDEAEQSIKYLNEQLSSTDVQEIKTVMYDLIEEQTKNLMLANVRNEFVFQVVDPAPYPEMKSGPKRVFIVLFAGLFGFFSVSIFFVFRLVMRKE
jgi:LPS O-antigen subunit length determinant protein (WzzB/FepE family)